VTVLVSWSCKHKEGGIKRFLCAAIPLCLCVLCALVVDKPVGPVDGVTPQGRSDLCLDTRRHLPHGLLPTATRNATKGTNALPPAVQITNWFLDEPNRKCLSRRFVRLAETKGIAVTRSIRQGNNITRSWLSYGRKPTPIVVGGREDDCQTEAQWGRTPPAVVPTRSATGELERHWRWTSANSGHMPARGC
jgi:hypothetical protein